MKLYPVEYGALGQLWAGTMPEALKHNGEVRVYFSVLAGLIGDGFSPAISLLFPGRRLRVLEKMPSTRRSVRSCGLGLRVR